MRSYKVYYDFEKFVVIPASSYDGAARKFCQMRKVAKKPVEIERSTDRVMLLVEGERMIKNYTLV